jgi:outer membrane murein-binding lipoprotein Lpp
VIWALLFVLLSGSGDSVLQAAFEQAAGNMKTLATDQAQRKQAVEILDAAAEATGKFEKKRKEVYDQWVKLARNDDTGDESFRELFDALEAGEQAFQSELIRARQELREILSREQWEKIFPPASGETPAR